MNYYSRRVARHLKKKKLNKLSVIAIVVAVVLQ